ncbi:MAG: hypothetical protein JWO36_4552 [Myxococcales bacterium]|nr:hypothetical protein [Myxococcales bacterium]
MTMKAMHLISTLSLLAPAVVYAEPESISASSDVDHYVAPVKDAFEISIGTGYSQSAGKVGGGMRNLEDLSGPGGAIELDLGYRVIPNLTLGAYGTFSKYQNGDSVDSSTDVLGATAGVQAAWHFRPEMSLDPWVSLGGGWKGVWLNPSQGKVTSLQGLELARLQVGLDYRVSPDVSISPVIGGSLGMFLQEDSPMTNGYTDIGSKKANFTGFAGLAGRFDVGGKR